MARRFSAGLTVLGLFLAASAAAQAELPPPPPGKPGLPFPFAGLWFRPNVHYTGPGLRALPEPFRPRGYGNLGVDPVSAYHMDYHRYVPTTFFSEHGPSYYPRNPLEYIDDQCHAIHQQGRSDRLKIRHKQSAESPEE